MLGRIVELIVSITIATVLGLLIGLQLLISAITKPKKFFFKEKRKGKYQLAVYIACQS